MRNLFSDYDLTGRFSFCFQLSVAGGRCRAGRLFRVGPELFFERLDLSRLTRRWKRGASDSSLACGVGLNFSKRSILDRAMNKFLVERAGLYTERNPGIISGLSLIKVCSKLPPFLAEGRRERQAISIHG